MSCAFENAEGAATTSSDSLYEAALSSVGQASLEESIKAFEQVIRINRQYAPAYAELTKLYIAQDSPDGRKRAERTIRDALRLAPDHSEYQLILGDVFWAQGFRYNAEKQYLKVFNTHPGSAKAAYWIGKRSVNEFIKYKDMLAVAPEFAKHSRERSIYFFDRCMDIDPAFKDAYFQLGLVHLENNEPREMVRVARRLLRVFPEDWEALLFCGLGYHAMGKHERAHYFYQEALKRMGEDERAVMESVELVADTILGDGLDIEAFWHQQNPLFLTPFNERRMAHYRRVAYANLRFSVPSKGIVGHQTDMGRAYIKFGQPLHRMSDRPGFRSLVPDDQISQQAATLAFTETVLGHVDPHLESWFYEGFTLDFINWDGLDNWTFSPTRAGFGFGQGGDALLGAEKHPYAGEIFQKAAPRFVDPYRNQKYSLPHLIAAFQEADKVRVEIAYAIPENRLKKTPEAGAVHIDNGLFLFDPRWRELSKQVKTNPELVHLREGVSENAFMMASHTINISPGDYHLVVEVGDRIGGSIGTFRERRIFDPPDTALAMSDLLLASRIEMKAAYPESRNDLQITPNPLRTFRRSEAVFIYLEIYNLSQDAFGQTRYDIAYRISPVNPATVDPALFEAHSLAEGPYVLEVQQTHPDSIASYQVQYRLSRRDRLSQQVTHITQETSNVETAVTSQYEGSNPNDFTFLEIDTGAIPAGVYKLVVTLKDTQTQQITEREVIFRVL